jgi:hypothetical protein
MNKGLVMFLTFAIVYVINLLFVRFLWNNALVKHVTILRPATTMLDTFLLALALTIVFTPFSGPMGFLTDGMRNGIKSL